MQEKQENDRRFIRLKEWMFDLVRNLLFTRYGQLLVATTLYNVQRRLRRQADLRQLLNLQPLERYSKKGFPKFYHEWFECLKSVSDTSQKRSQICGQCHNHPSWSARFAKTWYKSGKKNSDRVKWRKIKGAHDGLCIFCTQDAEEHYRCNKPYHSVYHVIDWINKVYFNDHVPATPACVMAVAMLVDELGPAVQHRRHCRLATAFAAWCGDEVSPVVEAPRPVNHAWRVRLPDCLPTQQALDDFVARVVDLPTPDVERRIQRPTISPSRMHQDLARDLGKYVHNAGMITCYKHYEVVGRDMSSPTFMYEMFLRVNQRFRGPVVRWSRDPHTVLIACAVRWGKNFDCTSNYHGSLRHVRLLKSSVSLVFLVTGVEYTLTLYKRSKDQQYPWALFSTNIRGMYVMDHLLAFCAELTGVAFRPDPPVFSTFNVSFKQSTNIDPDELNLLLTEAGLGNPNGKSRVLIKGDNVQVTLSNWFTHDPNIFKTFYRVVQGHLNDVLLLTNASSASKPVEKNVRKKLSCLTLNF